VSYNGLVGDSENLAELVHGSFPRGGNTFVHVRRDVVTGLLHGDSYIGRDNSGWRQSRHSKAEGLASIAHGLGLGLHVLGNKQAANV
jgi:hypothetical protein